MALANYGMIRKTYVILRKRRVVIFVAGESVCTEWRQDCPTYTSLSIQLLIFYLTDSWGDATINTA
eukprot:6199844-Pleurochrysis_carterae.AAC.6